MENNKTSRNFGFNSEKGYFAAVLIALIIVSSVIAVYYIQFKPAPSGYNTIYLLDEQNKAIDYPELLVANKNSTFNVPFVVENHKSQIGQYQVLVKITQNTISFPVNAPANSTFEKSVEDGKIWQDSASVSINQVGNYSAVFELWIYNTNTTAYEFTNNFCVLHLQVISG
jgi:uncharacterized membrane protein